MLKTLILNLVLIVFATAIELSHASEGLGTNSNINIEAEIKRFFPQLTVIGAKQQDVPVIPVYQLQELLGFVFESNDFVNIQGFSGNRVNMLIGMLNIKNPYFYMASATRHFKNLSNNSLAQR